MSSIEESKGPFVHRNLWMSQSGQLFDWKRGGFSTISGSFPLWVILLLQTIICILTVGLPILLVSHQIKHTPYPLIQSFPPSTLDPIVEILRWILFFGLGYTGYILTNIIIVFSMYFVYYSFVIRGKEVTHRLRRAFDHIFCLRYYVAWCTLSLFLVLSTFILFPLPLEEARLDYFTSTKGESSKDKKVILQETADVIEGLAVANYIRQYRASHSIYFFISRAAAALMVLTGIILVVKTIMQNISTMFYAKAYGTRVDRNTFALKRSKKMQNKILEKHTERPSMDIADLLFESLCEMGSSVITLHDIGKLLDKDEAQEYFSILDTEYSGKLSRQELKNAIDNLYVEEERLREGLLDEQNVVHKLDKIATYFAIFLSLIFWTILFQISFQVVITALTGIFSVLWAFTSNSMMTAAESIIFVIFTHPFDVGDNVVAKGVPLFVRELGLWVCTFESYLGQTTYMSNASLRSQMIINVTRSEDQMEKVAVNVIPSTPTEKIKVLEQKLLAFVKENSKDYIPKLAICGFDIIDKNSMMLEIPIFHRGNFHDIDLKAKRSNNFKLFLKEALVECGIQVSPPIWKVAER